MCYWEIDFAVLYDEVSASWCLARISRQSRDVL